MHDNHLNFLLQNDYHAFFIAFSRLCQNNLVTLHLEI